MKQQYPGILILLLLLPVAQSNDDAQTAREAFSRLRIPWYDATDDRLEPPPFPARPSPRSLDRADIPLAKIREESSNFSRFSGGAATAFAEILNYLLFFFLGLILLLLLIVMAWAFFRADAKRKSESSKINQPRSLAESIEQLPFQLDAESGDFRLLAERAYQQGDYRQAVIFLFSYLLVALDQSQLIRLRKGKTNRQYLRELQVEKPLAEYYTRVMEPFEAVFYGEHPLSRSEFESCWGGLNDFQRRVGSRSVEAKG